MKQINIYINEKLRLTTNRTYTCQPKKCSELQKIILKRIEDEGPNCDLNDIDVSQITNMSFLFSINHNNIFKDFNGDISLWNVSNVINMEYMFYGCEQFNCDLSMWNVSNVKDMDYMFCGCKNFDCNISKWNISNVKIIQYIFTGCKKFNQDLSHWDISNITNITGMFAGCDEFTKADELSQWDVSNIKRMFWAFYKCPTTPTWYDKNKWEQYS